MQSVKSDQPLHLETPREKATLDSLVEAARAALKNNLSLASALKPEELEKLRTRYSRFEDNRDSRGFITSGCLTVSKVSTPRPYLHLMTSGHAREYGTFGSFWDPCGAGFSCLDSVLAGSITSHKDSSYVPTTPRSTDHRHFWLREETADGVAIWHAFPQRGLEEETYDSFRCEQGLGTLRIVARRSGIRAELLAFVPLEGPHEAWRLELRNESERPRRLDLFMAVNWGLESYPGYYFDPLVVSQGRLYEPLHALVALNRDQNNKHPRSGFLMSRDPFDSFDLSGEEFTGGGHFRLYPRAVEAGRCTGSLGDQPYLGLIGALHFGLDLAPGESRSLEFLLGATSNEMGQGQAHLEGLRKAFFESEGVSRALGSLRSAWQDRVERHKARTPDTELDRFFNIWSKYQAANTARWTRALDKVGYRDLLQDLAGIDTFDPAYTRTMLPVALRYQLADGRAVRQFAKFPGSPHDLRMYMDSSVWIPDTLVDYAKESGDLAVLDEKEGFFDLQRGRVEMSGAASLYEHALRGIRGLFENRGLHGLCRIGHGDWNDSLDGVGRDGQGVSVWLSMALVQAAGRLRELTVWKKDDPNSALMDRIIGEMTRTINENAWDGSHYVYAFMGDGTPVGAESCDEGKIHLNVNTWALFNGVAAAAGRVETVLEAIRRLDTPLGHLLLSPSYTARSRLVGRIADMLPGLFENGSIYTHGQSFLIYALVGLGKGDEAWAELKKVLPGASLPDISTGPPHQVSNFSVGLEHPQFGRNMYSNFSGALSWLRKSLDRMYGLVADFDCLWLDPCIPSHWSRFEVQKVFRGCRVEAMVDNPRGVCRGVWRANLEGRLLAVGNGRSFIPLTELEGRESVRVEIELA